MRLAGRRPRSRPPADVLARAGAEKGDRVLAAAQSGKTWVLGTPLALLVVPPEGGAVQRIAWETVERAGWDKDAAVLEVVEVAEWGTERPVHRFAMEPPAPLRLLELVRERVTASIVIQRRVSVSGRRGFALNGRRSPVGGEVTWLVDYDAGVRPDDPLVAMSVADGLAAARGELI